MRYLVPFILFWLVLYLGRKELSPRAIVTFIAIWTVALYGCLMGAMSAYLFVALQSVLDVVLILMVFKGDIRVR